MDRKQWTPTMKTVMGALTEGDKIVKDKKTNKFLLKAGAVAIHHKTREGILARGWGEELKDGSVKITKDGKAAFKTAA